MIQNISLSQSTPNKCTSGDSCMFYNIATFTPDSRVATHCNYSIQLDYEVTIEISHSIQKKHSSHIKIRLNILFMHQLL